MEILAGLRLAFCEQILVLIDVRDSGGYMFGRRDNTVSTPHHLAPGKCLGQRSGFNTTIGVPVHSRGAWVWLASDLEQSNRRERGGRGGEIVSTTPYSRSPPFIFGLSKLFKGFRFEGLDYKRFNIKQMGFGIMGWFRFGVAACLG